MINGIMITGSTGFLGTHIVNEFRRNGYTPFICEHRGRMDGDLRDPEQVDEFVEENRPNLIIHTAGHVAGIMGNMMKPAEFLYDNLMMGANLIEAARRYKVSKFILIGTVCAYPAFAQIPFKESDIFDGEPEPTNAPYAYSKRCLMKMAEAYNRQYDMKICTLCPANLFGPLDNSHPINSHVISALISKMHEAKEQDRKSVTVWGSGKASRDFLYVDDCARAILICAEEYNGREIINLGSGIETTISELVEKVKKVVGFEGNVVFDTRKPDGQVRRCLDTSKARKLLGFAAATSLEDGLALTYKWFLDTKARNDSVTNFQQRPGGAAKSSDDFLIEERQQSISEGDSSL